MQKIGHKRGSIVESVLGRKKNHITTTFYLLCDKHGLTPNATVKVEKSSSSEGKAPPSSASLTRRRLEAHTRAAQGAVAGAAAALKAAKLSGEVRSQRPIARASSATRTRGFNSKAAKVVGRGR